MPNARWPYSGPVLVTGANGIVGRAVVRALRIAEIPCYALSRASHGSRSDVSLDLGAPSLDLTAALPTVPSAVVHLAAAVPHATEYPDTNETAAITRKIDATIASAVGRWGVPVIYASTCGLYDPLSPEPKAEGAQLKIRSPYFAAKLEGERTVRKLERSTVIRLSAVYGAGLRNTVVLAKFIEAARSGRRIEVWGAGKREQDFIHAEDVAACILAALQRPGSRILNVACGTPVTMLELAQIVTSVVASGHVDHVVKPDPNDAHTARYSVAKARDELGWRPAIALSKGIELLAAEAFRP